MRKKLPVLLILLLSPLILTACTVGDLPVIGKFLQRKIPSGPVTLTWWGLWEKPSSVDVLIKKYQEKHPNVTIKYDDRSVLCLIDYKERVFRRADQDSGPDILTVHNSWVQNPLLRTKLVPMPASLMTTDNFKKAFYPVVTDSAVDSGKVYAIPLEYDGLVLVYNKKHFADIGQTTAPTAWEEFRRLALELTVRNDKNIVRAGAAMGTADNNEHFSDILGLMWSQAGVKIPLEMDGKNAQDALAFYTNFIKEDGVWRSDFPEATAAFVKGDVSMIFIPTWKIIDILKAAPDLEFGVAPVPQVIPETPVTWGSFWMQAVTTKSAHSDVAWDFLNFIAQEQQQLTLFNEDSKTRPFGMPYSLISLENELSVNPYLGALVKTAKFAKSAEIAGRSGNSKQERVLKDAVNAVLNGTSPEDALKTAKDAISK